MFDLDVILLFGLYQGLKHLENVFKTIRFEHYLDGNGGK